jgi:hypothetical protein
MLAAGLASELEIDIHPFRYLAEKGGANTLFWVITDGGLDKKYLKPPSY